MRTLPNFKFNRQVLASVALLVAVLGVVLVTVRTGAADKGGGASLSLSPGSSSIAQGSTFNVDIYVSANNPTNAVAAKLSYPDNLLDFLDIIPSPAFNIGASSSGGGGAVDIERGALPAVKGKLLLATVRFKVTADRGTAAIDFTNGSAVISSDNNQNVLSGTTGANYTIGAATANPAPTPTSRLPEAQKEDDNTPLVGAQLSTCQDHEQDIKNVMARIIDRSQKQLNLYTTVSNEVQALYKKDGKTLSNYDALVADVNAKQTTAALDLSNLKLDSGPFSCSNSPKTTVNNFMNDLKSEISALNDYRTSVKNLISGVESVD